MLSDDDDGGGSGNGGSSPDGHVRAPAGGGAAGGGGASSSADDDDIVRIVISTDNHVGFMERDPVRGHDSFIAFEEVLRHARDTKVRRGRPQRLYTGIVCRSRASRGRDCTHCVNAREAIASIPVLHAPHPRSLRTTPATLPALLARARATGRYGPPRGRPVPRKQAEPLHRRPVRLLSRAAGRDRGRSRPAAPQVPVRSPPTEPWRSCASTSWGTTPCACR